MITNVAKLYNNRELAATHVDTLHIYLSSCVSLVRFGSVIGHANVDVHVCVYVYFSFFININLLIVFSHA